MTNHKYNQKYQQIIAWAGSILNESIQDIEIIAETPWSSVFRIITNQGMIYLKQTPEQLFIEVDVIKSCRQYGVNNIPNIIAADPNLYCFLMPKCGDLTLRDHFAGTIQLELYQQGIATYRNLQKLTIMHIEQFITFGVPDWRLDKFPELYRKLIANHDFLTSNGLHQELQLQLHNCSHKVAELCAKLASYKIPECLNHSDFHDNNIVLDIKNKTTSIIDSGETAINHPFFSLAAGINDAVRRYKLDKNSLVFKELQQACFTGWLDDKVDLQEVLQIIYLLLPVYLLFAHMRFADALSKNAFTNIPRMQNRIKEALLWFLQNIGYKT